MCDLGTSSGEYTLAHFNINYEDFSVGQPSCCVKKKAGILLYFRRLSTNPMKRTNPDVCGLKQMNEEYLVTLKILVFIIFTNDNKKHRLPID